MAYKINKKISSDCEIVFFITYWHNLHLRAVLLWPVFTRNYG